ncbi:MAG: fructosamine kinase family protein [Nitrospinae bacterium]|nr:fructosamine kinase family protein [Nitrospinota bacterium]
MKNDEIRELLSAVYGEPVRIESAVSVGGGCINETRVLTLSNGQKAFLKYHPAPPSGFFKAEARGLTLLGQVKNGPRAPKVLALQPGRRAHYLLLEYVEERSPGKEFYVRFGETLAELHRTSGDAYGLDHDNFIGKTPQSNAREKDPAVFYRERRIRFQQELARKSGLLPKSLDLKLDRLCGRLAEWIAPPGEKPALLHGDLWSGNYFADAGQRPFVFDPAVYYGLREADLAMTELFGRLPQAFYDAYRGTFPLAPGYDERKQLFNLYHLLNHLNLFGRSYLSSVERTVDYFVR